MYVKLLVTKSIEINGKVTTFRPGDWVDVGRQSAMVMVSRNEATIPNTEKLASLLPKDAVVHFTKDTPKARQYETRLQNMSLSVDFTGSDSNLLSHSYNLIAFPSAIAHLELIPVGFRLIEKWQVAAPLGSYEEMAIHIGTEEDRDLTKEVIRDLRVPWYDTRLLFVRRCSDTKSLFEAWNAEKRKLNGKTDSRLAFLRALYRVKPVICALPTTWLWEHARAER